MVSIDALFGFSLIALGVALTPGPNMVYATSRSLIQGRTAGIIALLGLLFGSLGYLVPAALGVGVLLSDVPRVYDVLRVAGAIYLGYLAWKAVHSIGWANVDSRPLAREGHAKLFRSGVLVSLLNPATALLYLTVFQNSSIPRVEARWRRLLCSGWRLSSSMFRLRRSSLFSRVRLHVSSPATQRSPGHRVGRPGLRWPFSR